MIGTWRWFLFFYLAATGVPSCGQPSDSINHKRLNGLVATTAVVYTGTMVGLGEIWYSNFDHQSFRFFDDSKEWMQIDKIGHFYSTFQASRIGSASLQWAGVSKSKADKIGAVASMVAVSSIEIFDGRSSGYGASASDLIANVLGAGAYVGQQLLWNEIRVYPKLSFHTTHLSNQRPDVLGSNLLEKVVKDYNGQTHWLSVDIDKFTPFPKWLNIAIGYGAHDMIFANQSSNLEAGYQPYRQYYLSIDLDLNSIKTESKALRALLQVLSAIKLPSPAIEFSKNGIKTYPFYF